MKNSHNFFLQHIAQIVADYSDNALRPIQVMDFGCGEESPVKKLRSMDCLRYKDVEWIGADIYKPALEASKSKGIHDRYLWISEGRLDQAARADIVLLFDVIEHLDKKNGIDLLDSLSKIAKIVIVYTPNGFLYQDGTDNPFQRHRSGWTVQEFSQKGYVVYGCGGWLWLQQSQYDDTTGKMVWTWDLKRPQLLFRMLRFLSSWAPPQLFHGHPKISSFLYAIKDHH